LLREARSGWAAFADVKIERNGHQGVVFRTTKADDERQLRQNNKNVQVVSIQKVNQDIPQNIHNCMLEWCSLHYPYFKKNFRTHKRNIERIFQGSKCSG
jgi:hypothetical protein